MQNGLHSPVQAPQTSNPQGAAPSRGASKSADFQETAPSDVLSEQARALSVENTGEPLDGRPADAGGSLSFAWWGLGLLLVLVLAGMYVIRLFTERDELIAEEITPPKPAVSARKTAAKKPARKTASGKPTKKRRKKPARGRR